MIHIEISKGLIFDAEHYNFFKKRLMALSGKHVDLGIVRDILTLLDSKGAEGMYYTQILSSIHFSDASFRYVIYSLFSANFVDLRVLGRMSLFSINQNGKRLLDDLKSN